MRLYKRNFTEQSVSRAEKIVRQSEGLGFRHHTGPFLNQHRLLMMYNTSFFSRVLLLYKCSFLNSVRDWFRFFESSAYHTTCSFARILIVPYIRTAPSRPSIAYIGPSLWNYSPLELNSIGNLTTFKVRLKEHLFSRLNFFQVVER